jgi:hypothetical protein
MGQVGRMRRTEGVDKYEDKKKGGGKGKGSGGERKEG